MMRQSKVVSEMANPRCSFCVATQRAFSVLALVQWSAGVPLQMKGNLRKKAMLQAVTNESIVTVDQWYQGVDPVLKMRR